MVLSFIVLLCYNGKFQACSKGEKEYSKPCIHHLSDDLRSILPNIWYSVYKMVYSRLLKRKKSSVMENMSKKIKKKVTKQSTHCISIWYKDNVFYCFIFVISSFIPTEPESGRDYQANLLLHKPHAHMHTHKCTHTWGGWDQGIGFLFSVHPQNPVPGLDGACNLGVLGDVVV